MHPSLPYGPFKLLALIVILLLVLSLVYAGYISIAHWSGIGV